MSMLYLLLNQNDSIWPRVNLSLKDRDEKEKENDVDKRQLQKLLNAQP